jgi:hypothetical protein
MRIAGLNKVQTTPHVANIEFGRPVQVKTKVRQPTNHPHRTTLSSAGENHNISFALRNS